MSVYAIIYLILSAMSFGIVLVKHGQPREDWNIWVYMLGSTIGLSLLYFGGFFDKV